MGLFDQVTTGLKAKRAERVLLYGTTGVGKTSAACSFPKPIVFPAEDGLDALPDVPRLPLIRKWEDLEKAMAEFASKASKLPFETAVFDTADAFERLCWEYTCRNNFQLRKWKSLETPGWGKGYTEAEKVWTRSFFPLLDALHESGIHVVILAQAMVKTWNNPTGESFDRYQLKLHHRSASLFQEWVADHFFCRHWTGVSVGKDAKGQVKVTGQSSGERIAHTVWDAAWNAKHRLPVPDEIVMPDPLTGSFYEALLAARAEGRGGAPRKEKKQEEAESEPDDENPEEPEAPPPED